MLLQATCELRVTGLKYPTFPHILGKGGRFRTALGYYHPESHLFFTYFGERWEISHRPGVSSPRKFATVTRGQRSSSPLRNEESEIGIFLFFRQLTLFKKVWRGEGQPSARQFAVTN